MQKLIFISIKVYWDAALAEAIQLIASNPLVSSMVTGIASNAAYDVIKNIISHLYNHFKSKPEAFETEKVEKMKAQFAGIFERYDKGLWASVDKKFSIQFQQFLFPNRKVVLEQLEESQCEYIAERVFYGVSFQSILVETGFKQENVKYMFAFPSRYLGSPYYFDIKAKRDLHCIDQLLVARVVDNRTFDPIESLQAMPTRMKEISDRNPEARFRDFDLYTIIHTGEYVSDLNMRMRDILETLQKNQPSCPRFVFFEKQELDDLMKLGKEDRKVSIKHKF